MRRAPLALFRDFRRALGTRRALLRLPGWLLRRELAVLTLDLERSPLPPPPEVPLDWSPVGAAEVPLVAALNPALDPAAVRRALAAGEEWWLARLDGEPVHFRAYATGRVELPYLGRALRLEADDVLLGTAYTAAGRRRRGVLAAAAHWSQRHVRARGHRRMIALVAPWNEAPRRVAERTGFVEIGRVGRWTWGPWRRWFAGGAVRFDESGDLRLPPHPSRHQGAGRKAREAKS
jgi:hypothetical protein